jgi:hypothetical protein
MAYARLVVIHGETRISRNVDIEATSRPREAQLNYLAATVVNRSSERERYSVRHRREQR